MDIVKGNNKTEIYLIIVWNKGLSIQNDLVFELRENFTEVKEIEIKWEKEFFFENLKRFYAHSHMERSLDDFERIIREKIVICGEGKFVAYVFKDENVCKEVRQTSSGDRVVNTNVFDLKARYRKLFNGESLIHSSDNIFETNKDLVLLFGTTVEDFYLKNELAKTRTSNIQGVPNWKDLKQLFFVLNNTINYVVMRNFEGLPHDFKTDIHGDIDLLVESKGYAQKLLGATNEFPELDYRVFHFVKVGAEKVYFDFRYLGDNYYDLAWQLEILKTRKKIKEGFFVPNDENLFYSLLYHAYVQKSVIASDYPAKLEKAAEKNGVSFPKEQSSENSWKLLNNYIETKGYQYVIPIDKTVFYNIEFINKNSSKLNNNEVFISSQLTRAEDKNYITQVFETELGFKKNASNPICENENLYLNRLKNYDFFPKVLRYKQGEEKSEILLEKIIGPGSENIKFETGIWTKVSLTQIFIDAIQILMILKKEKIAHRDIRPENLILRKVSNNGYRLVLIDFGWATELINDGNDISPPGLGSIYKKNKDEFSDVYSMCKVLSFFGFFRFKAFNEVILKLLEIEDKSDRENFNFEVASVLNTFKSVRNKFSIIEEFKILGYKNYPIIKKIVQK